MLLFLYWLWDSLHNATRTHAILSDYVTNLVSDPCFNVTDPDQQPCVGYIGQFFEDIPISAETACKWVFDWIVNLMLFASLFAIRLSQTFISVDLCFPFRKLLCFVMLPLLLPLPCFQDSYMFLGLLHVTPEGRPGYFWCPPPCLESEGCQFDPTFLYLLSSSA